MLKSVAGFLILVSDLKKSEQFYKDLGFEVNNSGGMTSAKLNWFRIWMVDQKESNFQQDVERFKGGGIYIYLRVDDVDQTYQDLKKKGFEPSSEPKDWPWGNREFALKDPDGYKLVFYQPI